MQVHQPAHPAPATMELSTSAAGIASLQIIEDEDDIDEFDDLEAFLEVLASLWRWCSGAREIFAGCAVLLLCLCS